MKEVVYGVLTYKVLSVSLVSLFTISMGANLWGAYKMMSFESTVQDQLNGTFTKTADLIRKVDERIGTVESTMLTQEDLEARAKQIISGLDVQTQKHIKEFQEETGAKIKSISERFTTMEVTLEGKARLGGRRDKREKTPTPPATWKGVSREDLFRCEDHPEKCAPFEFEWESPYRFQGSSIARLSGANIWGDEFRLKLNLAFKVVTIGYGEDQSKRGAGAVANQGLHIYAGYVDEDGKFVTLAEQKMLKGNPLLDSKVFYIPQGDLDKSSALELFAPSFLVGTTYQEGDLGLSLGASLLNFSKGRYRLGGNFVISSSKPYVGAFASYHPLIGGRNLNLAPSLGWVLGADQSNTWSLGLQFQVW